LNGLALPGTALKRRMGINWDFLTLSTEFSTMKGLLALYWPYFARGKTEKSQPNLPRKNWELCTKCKMGGTNKKTGDFEPP